MDNIVNFEQAKNQAKMNILVNSGLKKKIQIENRKHRKGIYYLWLFEKISLALVIAYAILFPIYCIVTGNFVSTNMRTGELSYFLVASFTSCIVAMGLTAVLLIYVLRMRLEHTFIGGRIDEMIEIVDDKLFYVFRIKYQTPADKRNIVVIDLNRINKLSYDYKLSEISIDGMMVEKIVNTSTDVHKIKISEMVDSHIKINDYFIPSLHEVLKTKVN